MHVFYTLGIEGSFEAKLKYICGESDEGMVVLKSLFLEKLSCNRYCILIILMKLFEEFCLLAEALEVHLLWVHFSLVPLSYHSFTHHVLLMMKQPKTIHHILPLETHSCFLLSLLALLALRHKCYRH